MRQYYWSSRMTVVMASDTCKRCCLCKTYSMNDSRLPLVRSTHYKKQFNTFHCGGTIYLSASDTQDCNKTVFRNTETMTTSDMITHLTFWTSFTQRQRQSCTGSGQLTLLDPVKMSNDALDLLIYLFFYVWVSVHERTRSVLRVFVPVSLCLVSNRVKGFCVACLYLFLWGCASSYALTFDERGDNKGQKSSKLCKHSLFSKHSTQEQHFTLCTKTWSKQLWSEIKPSCVPKMLWHVSDNWLDTHYNHIIRVPYYPHLNWLLHVLNAS